MTRDESGNAVEAAFSKAAELELERYTRREIGSAFAIVAHDLLEEAHFRR